MKNYKMNDYFKLKFAKDHLKMLFKLVKNFLSTENIFSSSFLIY